MNKSENQIFINEISTEDDLFELKRLAIDALGSEETAERWLTRKHGLYQFVPIEFARTKNGLKEVRRILAVIEYGGCI